MSEVFAAISLAIAKLLAVLKSPRFWAVVIAMVAMVATSLWIAHSKFGTTVWPVTWIVRANGSASPTVVPDTSASTAAAVAKPGDAKDVNIEMAETAV